MDVMAILDSAQGIVEETDASLLQFKVLKGKKNTTSRRATVDFIPCVVDDDANSDELQAEFIIKSKSLEETSKIRPRRSRRASLICVSSFIADGVDALDIPMEDNRKQYLARSA